jgi:hypothetical protein
MLDLKGRHTLSPSLYERDAYQAFLRKNPDQCSGVRFDVQWKLNFSPTEPLKLRVELRGSKGPNLIVLEGAIRPNHWYNRWNSLRLEGESYEKSGQIIAWQASLWAGGRLLAQQKSFLW